MAKNKIIDNPVEAVDEVIKEDVLLTGVVTDCFRLNIRFIFNTKWMPN